MKPEQFLRVASLLLLVVVLLVPTQAGAQSRTKRKTTTTAANKPQNNKFVDGAYQLTCTFNNKATITSRRFTISDNEIDGYYEKNGEGYSLTGCIESDGSVVIYESMGLLPNGLYQGNLTGATTIAGTYTKFKGNSEKTLNFKLSLKLLSAMIPLENRSFAEPIDAKDATELTSVDGWIGNERASLCLQEENEGNLTLYTDNNHDQERQLIVESHDKQTQRYVLKAYLRGEYIGTFNGIYKWVAFTEPSSDGEEYGRSIFKGKFTNAHGKTVPFYLYSQCQPG